jgi:hypothetical protein
MIFSVIPLRRRGRRIPESHVRAAPGLVGDLLTEVTGHPREVVVVARLRPLSGPLAEDLLPALYAPTIVRVAPLSLCLRGYEAHGAGPHRVTTLQEWLCSQAR